MANEIEAVRQGGAGGSHTAMSRASAAKPATILSGASLSSAVDLEGGVLIALSTPAGWTAADITFQASDLLTGTYLDVYDDAGTEVKIPTAAVAASRIIANNGVLERLAPLRFLKIRSGTSGAPVAQGADRAFLVNVKG